jgi:predicted aldo/keto reductase-like oxidoreductase
LVPPSGGREIRKVTANETLAYRPIQPYVPAPERLAQRAAGTAAFVIRQAEEQGMGIILMRPLTSGVFQRLMAEAFPETDAFS